MLLAAAVVPFAWLPVLIPEILGTDGFPSWFWPVHLTFMAYGVALIIVAVRLVLRNKTLSDGQRVGWLVAVLFLSPLALIAYLLTRLRPATSA